MPVVSTFHQQTADSSPLASAQCIAFQPVSVFLSFFAISVQFVSISLYLRCLQARIDQPECELQIFLLNQELTVRRLVIDFLLLSFCCNLDERQMLIIGDLHSFLIEFILIHFELVILYDLSSHEVLLAYLRPGYFPLVI